MGYGVKPDKTGLASLTEGESAVVTGLLAQGAMRRRLLDLGIVEGTRIRCLLISPNGDPAAYLIRGAVIALRSEDAATVSIRRRDQITGHEGE